MSLTWAWFTLPGAELRGSDPGPSQSPLDATIARKRAALVAHSFFSGCHRYSGVSAVSQALEPQWTDRQKSCLCKWTERGEQTVCLRDRYQEEDGCQAGSRCRGRRH